MPPAKHPVVCYAHRGNSTYDELFLKALAQRFDCEFFSFDSVEKVPPSIKTYYQPLRIKGMSAATLHTTILGEFFWHLARLVRFRASMRDLRPDLIFAGTASTYGFYAAFSGLPFVIAIWGTEVTRATNPFKRAVVSWSIKRARRVLVDSKVHEAAVARLGARKSRIVRFMWGVEMPAIDFFKAREEVRRSHAWKDEFVIVHTRQHEPIYDIPTVIRAFASLKRAHTNLRLLILGNGNLTEALKSMVLSQGLGDSVTFTGWVSYQDALAYMASSDAYVSASTEDGSSSSLVEALLVGLPVVVTDIPGNRQWVTDDVNGFLCPVGSPADLAAKIELLIKRPDLRRSFAEAGRMKADSEANWESNKIILYDVLSASVTGGLGRVSLES